jgi:hypothetical protein
MSSRTCDALSFAEVLRDRLLTFFFFFCNIVLVLRACVATKETYVQNYRKETV